MQLKIVLVIASISVAPAVTAAESLRCNSRVVSDGDPKAKVAAICGEPTQIEQRTVLQSGIPRTIVSADTSRREAIAERELLIPDRSFVEVEVDVWLYNRGPGRLLREIIFRNNRVVEINTLGHGF